MHGEVLSATRLTPSLVRVVLGGWGLDGFEMPAETDTYINIAIPPLGAPYGPVYDPREVHDSYPREWWPARRRYTVREWDARSRQLTLDFVLHVPAGPAGAWAAAAQPGDVLIFNGPGGGYRPASDTAWHLMVGDESALPAIAASVERLPPEAQAVVLLVCDGPEHEVDLHSPAQLDLRWIHRSEADPTPLIRAVADARFLTGSVHAFIHGEAEEIRTIRRQLILERGIADSDMSCSPYWRRGMSDEQWRAVKKDFVVQMTAEA